MNKLVLISVLICLVISIYAQGHDDKRHHNAQNHHEANRHAARHHLKHGESHVESKRGQSNVRHERPRHHHGQHDPIKRIPSDGNGIPHDKLKREQSHGHDPGKRLGNEPNQFGKRIIFKDADSWRKFLSMHRNHDDLDEAKERQLEDSVLKRHQQDKTFKTKSGGEDDQGHILKRDCDYEYVYDYEPIYEDIPIFEYYPEYPIDNSYIKSSSGAVTATPDITPQVITSSASGSPEYTTTTSVNPSNSTNTETDVDSTGERKRQHRNSKPVLHKRNPKKRHGQKDKKRHEGRHKKRRENRHKNLHKKRSDSTLKKSLKNRKHQEKKTT